MSRELITVGQQHFLPVLSVTEAVQRRSAIVEFVREVMIPDVDFGKIPGIPKMTLLKPGAEKLCTLFGLSPRFQILQSIEDWTGERYGGEPFFYYLYRCQLWRPDLLIAEGDGSCNSFETKYRYRDAQRVCPECGKAAIIKGREEFGGGWLCFAKRGGCGAKFADGEEIIESQPVGRILNPDVADQVNTIQKMGQKRSLIAATLLAVNASEFFTQDVEDRQIVVEPIPATSVSEPSDTPSSPSDSTPTDDTEPPLPKTAAEAMAAFEQKAREKYAIHDKKLMALLAVALLGERPERWTMQVWQEATEKPEAAWANALQILQTVSSPSES